jgi:ribonuclease Z
LAHHDDLTWDPGVEVHEHLEGVVFDEGGVRIVAAPTDHRPVHPSVGYRVEHDGASVVIAGDTVPCAGLDALCEGADALVHTVIREDLVRAIPVPRLQDILDYHSSVQQAAQTAARGGVGTLVLTHYVPPMLPGTEDEWRALAAAHFSGTIELGDDLHRVEVSSPS